MWEKGEYLREKLNILKEKYPQIVKDVRGLDLFIVVDLPDWWVTIKVCYQYIKKLKKVQIILLE